MGIEEVTESSGAYERLRFAIDHLYAIFAEYPLLPDLSDPLWPEKAEHISKPLREFGVRELPEWVWKGTDEWGGDDEFKHFLPRVLELLAQDKLSWPEFTLAGLTKARWHEWPEQERHAVQDYLMALWRYLLEDAGAWSARSLEADHVLCGIAAANEDLTPYLQVWRETRTEASLVHLARLLDTHYSQLLKKKRLGDLWPRYPAQMAQVLEWLIDPATAAMLEEGFFDYANGEWAERLSVAYEQADWIRRTWRSRWDTVHSEPRPAAE